MGGRSADLARDARACFCPTITSQGQASEAEQHHRPGRGFRHGEITATRLLIRLHLPYTLTDAHSMWTFDHYRAAKIVHAVRTAENPADWRFAASGLLNQP
jgi:hypothetical protein